MVFMEKKTIGAFIAALRRANGMTQRELADRLSVSDKTVSRWERDDGAPDISLIPVIAEIFGVTCDELRRGERRSAEEREEISAKGAEQRKYLMRRAMSSYEIRSAISAGIMCLGLIAAFICNFAFLRSRLGFFLGITFYLVGAFCQGIFINRALLSVEEAPGREEFKNRVIRLAALVFGLAVGLLAFTWPMALVDTYSGVTAGPLFMAGLIFAAGAIAVYGIVFELVMRSMIERGVYLLDDRGMDVYRRNFRLRRTLAIALAGIIAVTAVAHGYLRDNPEIFVRDHKFYDSESFVEFMGSTPPQFGNVPAASVNVEGDEEPEEPVLTLKDKNGDTVCEYVWRNHTVKSIEVNDRGDSPFPITVVINRAYTNAWRIVSIIDNCALAIYGLEIVTVIAIYFKKRGK